MAAGDWLINDEIILPGDLMWADEHWQPRRQSEDLSLSGGVIIQRSRQTAGRPITLETYRGVFVTRAEVLALESLLDDVDKSTFEVKTPEGAVYPCAFRHSDGPPIDAAPLQFRSPQLETDIYDLTVRFMMV